MDTTATAFYEITKSEKQDDGTLLVRGVATDSTLDIDQQICDPEWLKDAMPQWFKWGNVRYMHQSEAVGTAEAYEEKDGAHHITARVVDPTAVKKVEHGVLKGFSIGIRRPHIVADKAAPGGVIRGGEIVEVSLVDRPANPSCTLTLAKSAAAAPDWTGSPEDLDRGLVRVEELTEKAAETEPLEGDPTGTAPDTDADGGEVGTGDTGGAGEGPDGDAGADPTPGDTDADADAGGAGEPDGVDPNPADTTTADGVDDAGDDTTADDDTAGDDTTTDDATGDDAGEAEPEKASAADVTALAAATGMPTDYLAGLTLPVFNLLKAAHALTAARPTTGDLTKRDYSDKERADMADSGQAMPHGGFPIKTVKDLKNAIQSIGRAKDPDAAKQHIKARAKALGKDNLIPDGWKAAGTDVMAHNPAQLTALRNGLLDLIIAEAQEAKLGESETYDIGMLLQALNLFLMWWDGEAWEGETTPSADNKAADPDTAKGCPGDCCDACGNKTAAKAAGPDDDDEPVAAAKAATPKTPAAEAGKTLDADSVKAAVAEAVKEVLGGVDTRLEDIAARLAQVEKRAAPGGPVRTRPLHAEKVSRARDSVAAEIRALQATAATIYDAGLRTTYAEAITAKQAELRRLDDAAGDAA